MRDLSRIRDDWPAIEAEKARLLRELTVEQGLRDFSLLYEAFGGRLQDDAEYRAEYDAALIERQERLARLAAWLAGRR